MDEARGLECLWGNINEHPHCPHGPTLLFAKNNDDGIEKFYACSACRDRKLCSFYLKYGDKLSKHQQNAWDQEKKKVIPSYQHQKLFIRFNELLSQDPTRRYYCHNCEKFIFTSEKDKHKDHEQTENLTDYQMRHPTEVLKPLSNAKKEAQYLFSKKATETLVNMLLKLGAKQVLCIGAPRIHEYISENFEDKMSSLLLDFDNRFHNFFGPLNFCWYNLFNNHFFYEDSKGVFKDFMTQNGGKGTFLVCDPPFGGRLEPISQTIKTITEQHKKWNNIATDDDFLKIMFIFPYFMESVMREKSTPHSQSGGLKELKMTDYKVNYDNHPLFLNDGAKNGSPVRIFTNIPLRIFELPEEEGYRYCKRCQKWISKENKHCKKCKACTSKDGRRYRHCKICERCVKPTWMHCNTCNRCCLEKHKCGEGPVIKGRCFKCDEYGHIEKDCTVGKQDNDTKENKVESKKSRKRKLNNESDTSSEETLSTKKLKTNGTKKKKTELIKKLKLNDPGKDKFSKVAKAQIHLQKKSKSSLKQNKFKERKKSKPAKK